MSDKEIKKSYDLICVGGGIMSATLALMTKLIDPKKEILILERLDEVARESSGVWNNAGTGHSGFCELNYTTEKEDGTMDISKAVNVASEFERSKQFWSYLIKQGYIENPKEFIHPVPHHAWVTGEENVTFLHKRFEEMRKNILFQGMEYTEDFKQLEKWIPLMMSERTKDEKLAATRMELGTELNYGTLTQRIFQILEEQFDTKVKCQHEVLDIDPDCEEEWVVIVKCLRSNKEYRVDAKHVFIGAGGGAISLLQKVEIKEKEGYGGFPVSGEWLICKNRSIIEQHNAKVYSKEGLDAPPMSVPHLDTRYVNGQKELLFGPFAGFNTKFLKHGSYLDLFKSVKWKNIPAYWGVFWHNLPLTKYLISQVTMNHKDRMNELRKFVKDAKDEDWELKIAGQRVQVIKKDEKMGGILEFGTEVVHGDKGRVTALLGASPGASTAVQIMLEVLQLAFPKEIKTATWQNKLSEMIPFWNKSIDEFTKEAFIKERRECSRLLEIEIN